MSFVTEPPKDGATLTEWISYLKPKSKSRLASELRRSFQSRDPVEQTEPSILDELGMDARDFAEIALNSPDVWDTEQRHYLESFVDGQADEGRMAELAEDYFTALPHAVKQPQPTQEEEQAESISLPLMIAQPALTPINEPEPLPVVGESTDFWWRKKK